MKVVYSIAEMQKLRHKLGSSVGFVPTMGYLHEGHLALVRRARCENENVVVSIFVNPTQFDVRADLEAYPRDLKRDLALLEGERVDIVFMPTVEEMYPQGFSTWVGVEKVAERLEGAARPGHFRGVATVVAKLFNIVEPHRAYFGNKDAQQAVVIKRMVCDLNMSVEIIAVPTVRESDGLALSSRNIRLSPKERQAALVLWQALQLAQRMWSDGEHDAQKICYRMRALIESEPLAEIDYVSIADAETLEELEKIDRPALVSLAVKIGNTRLIDNITLGGVRVEKMNSQLSLSRGI
jgi:pantoate--beta-alanine ligase